MYGEVGRALGAHPSYPDRPKCEAPQVQRGIPTELRTAEAALSNLENILGELLTRLEPVSRSQPECDGSEDKAQYPPSDVGRQVNTLANRIRRAANRIEIALGLLEI